MSMATLNVLWVKFFPFVKLQTVSWIRKCHRNLHRRSSEWKKTEVSIWVNLAHFIFFFKQSENFLRRLHLPLPFFPYLPSRPLPLKSLSLQLSIFPRPSDLHSAVLRWSAVRVGKKRRERKGRQRAREQWREMGHGHQETSQPRHCSAGPLSARGGGASLWPFSSCVCGEFQAKSPTSP